MTVEEIHKKVKELLYSFTGITLAQNKDVMISNRLEKLKRDTKYQGSIEELLKHIEKGHHVTEFINSFTTNKTHFFREVFHFEDLRDRVLPEFAKSGETVKIYSSAASTGEEPYSIAMTIKEVEAKLHSKIKSEIIATDIDTNVLKHAANGVYRYSKSSKEFPEWIDPRKYFKRRVNKTLIGDEILIKVKKEIRDMLVFAKMNLNDEEYPFDRGYFDVIFCRNVLIYFTNEDQNKILKKLFRYLKMGGTLYLGHSESPHDLAFYTKRIGQNIYIKVKECEF